MLFKDIPGFEQIKKQLIHAVKDKHVAHAQLFMSKGGGANLALALAYSTYLNCEQPSDDDACGQCSSCVKNIKFIHPDMQFVYPVGAANNISGKDVVSVNFLKEWRDFLLKNTYGDVDAWANHFGGENKQLNISKQESRNIIKSLSLKAFEAKFKIMLIWLPEFMHVSSANGILKILEEPPENTIFLLVSNDEEKLLTTITSRTQIVNIRRMNVEEVTEYLVKHHNADETKAHKVARIADGDVSEAIALLDGADQDIHDLFKQWMRYCFQPELQALVNMAEDFHKMSKINQRSLLQYGIEMMRESLLSTVAADELLRFDDEEGAFVAKFSKVMTVDKVARISSNMGDAIYHLERNASAKIIFLDLSLQIAKAIK